MDRRTALGTWEVASWASEGSCPRLWDRPQLTSAAQSVALDPLLSSPLCHATHMQAHTRTEMGAHQHTGEHISQRPKRTPVFMHKHPPRTQVHRRADPHPYIQTDMPRGMCPQRRRPTHMPTESARRRPARIHTCAGLPYTSSSERPAPPSCYTVCGSLRLQC